MPETEEVFSARDVAHALGIGSAMLRRYAQAYETASGEKVELHPRDGRIFTGKHLEVLQRARAIVQRDNSSVEAAVSQALERPEQSLELRVPTLARFDTELLTEALRRSQQPLLEKLSSIEAELRALRAENQVRGLDLPKEKGETISPRVSSESDTNRPDQTHDGFLVRLARRLERVMWRR